MLEQIQVVAEYCAVFVELIGIAIIGIVSGYALLYVLVELFKREKAAHVFDRVRSLLGRGIMLGLEFLVGADIIHTVAVDLTFNTVGVLAIIVLIRTFLSFTLEVELTGRWPWQQKEQ